LYYPDPYDLIGTGNFSRVYNGYIMNGEDKIKTAVKIPNIEKPEDIEALQNELKTLSRTELRGATKTYSQSTVTVNPRSKLQNVVFQWIDRGLTVQTVD